VRDYRLYLIGMDGHFRQVVELACSSDSEAIAFVAERYADDRCELWQLTRMVATTDARRHEA